MNRLKPTTRSWLIFAGLVVLALSLPMLKWRAFMVMGKLGVFVALLGVALILLGKHKPKERDAENR